MQYIYIGIGGFCGAISRYAIGKLFLAQNFLFPWHTFMVNLLGSFFVALILTIILRGMRIRDNLQKLITVGFISSFTTYSTFSYEIFYLIQLNKWLLGLGYGLLSVIFGLVVCWLGIFVGKIVVNKDFQRGERKA